jgi:hypothetical protein
MPIPQKVRPWGFGSSILCSSSRHISDQHEWANQSATEHADLWWRVQFYCAAPVVKALAAGLTLLSMDFASNHAFLNLEIIGLWLTTFGN